MSDILPTIDQPITFEQFELAPAILTAIKEVGYETPSAIQAASIPPLLAGRDLLGQAQTGTGKTAAFALPLLSRIDPSSYQTQLLVLTPTRELAIQVSEAMQKYGHHLPDFHILPIYGGQGMGTQLRMLKRGVQVVVGTPGRILDHLSRGTLDLSHLKAIVLDEADEMLRMGFIDDVDEILKHTPETRQVALFSATMPDQIRRIALKHLHDPEEIKIAAKTTTVESISQHYWIVRGINKLDALTRILEVTDFDAMIIFVRTKISTEELADRLAARGFASAALNGDMNQQQREKTVEHLRQGKLDILIATDVAARGLDVPRISHVVNYDIPHDIESYVHRIGRTGRAGRKGEAILFVAPRETRMLRAIEQATRQKVSLMQLPTKSEIVDRRVEQFKRSLIEMTQVEGLEFFKELLNNVAEETGLGQEDLAAALAYWVQREQPLQPDIQDIPTEPERRERERSSRGERGERFERGDRGERGEREDRFERSSRGRTPAADMVRYRIEVGREHGVQPKHIVGAIANELDMDSQNIQNLDIRNTFSLVDLPQGLSKDAFMHLKKVRVCGRKLEITADAGAPTRPSSSGRRFEERGSFEGRERSSSDRPERESRGERPERERGSFEGRERSSRPKERSSSSGERRISGDAPRKRRFND
ncbi:DEAD/DEAH box helicase [Thiofilum flexile]|uniref:DEAD/DEAH box helicase n=1 Tax=Thiofilum flexile TaxID=125627 RepID=UPI00037D8384|nr:DEAD/DEAH box helicase [Thiofilum flexile]